LPAWKKYAQPLGEINRNHNLIAVVMNYHPQIMSVDSLPALPLTMAIDADQITQGLVDKLRQKGYDVLINLPFVADGEDVLGNYVKPIGHNMPYEEMKSRLAWHFERVNGVIGFKNSASSKVMEVQYIMGYVMNVLKEQQMSFLEVNSNPNIRSIANASAVAAGIPTLKVDMIFKDIPDDMNDFLQRLSYTRKGVALLEATPQNIALLSNEITKLQGKPYQFVPLSSLYALNELKIEK